jgi:transposase-like protein
MRHDMLSASEIRRLLRSASQLELSSDAVQKLKWFLFAAEHAENVSLTCRHFGISRSTYLRWSERFDANDLSTLDEHSRSPHTVREPETDPKVVTLIAELRTAQPMIGKEAISAILQQSHSITVSSSTVGRVISRHGLFFAETASHRRKRAQYMESETIHTTVNTTPSTASAETSESLGYLPSPGISS